LASYVDRRKSGRPGEGEEVPRVRVEEGIDNVERGKLLCIPHLFVRVSGKRAGEAKEDRRGRSCLLRSIRNSVICGYREIETEHT
jgi:hypothetical protein